MRALLLLLALWVSGCSGAFRSTVVLSPADLEARIAQKFPMKKEDVLATVALENPRVLLGETGDRITVEVDARVRIAVIQVKGSAGISGRLDFDKASRTVFLTDCRLARLDVPGFDEGALEPVREAIDVALVSNMTRIPLHELSGPRESFVQSVRVENGSVIVEVGL